MSEPDPGEPWAFIAHKNGAWAGVAAANMPKKELSEFLGDFAAEGFGILTVFSRIEFEATIAKMKPPTRNEIMKASSKGE